MAQRLREFAILTEDPVQFSVPAMGGSQPPVTLAPDMRTHSRL